MSYPRAMAMHLTNRLEIHSVLSIPTMKATSFVCLQRYLERTFQKEHHIEKDHPGKRARAQVTGYHLFHDFRSAYDNIRWGKIYEALQEMDIPTMEMVIRDVEIQVQGTIFSRSVLSFAND